MTVIVYPKRSLLKFCGTKSWEVAFQSLQFQPKYCVLAEASVTHAVFVYTIHQNVKLVISDAKLYDLTEK
jgi:hypothetical protein